MASMTPESVRALYLPKLECAWCRKTLREGAGPVSHGICGPCSEGVLRDAEPSIGRRN